MLIPSGYAQANFVLSGNNLPLKAECTLGLDIQGASGGPQDIADNVRDSWDQEIMPLLNQSTEHEVTIIKFGPSATGPTFEAPSTAVGTTMGASASSAVSFLVRKTTNFGGRAGRGRMYLPGVTEDEIGGDGAVDGTFLSTAQTALQDFLDLLDGVGIAAVLLHGADSPLSSPTVITSMVMDGVVATQRRRQRR